MQRREATGLESLPSKSLTCPLESAVRGVVLDGDARGASHVEVVNDGFSLLATAAMICIEH